MNNEQNIPENNLPADAGAGNAEPPVATSNGASVPPAAEIGAPESVSAPPTAAPTPPTSAAPPPADEGIDYGDRLERLGGEPAPVITPEEFARLQRQGQVNIDAQGRVRTTRRSDAEAGVSLRKRRAWYCAQMVIHSLG
jgi:hypothetical protein